MNWTEELTCVKDVVQRAGVAIEAIAREHYQVAATHVDRTVLTQADLEADRILRECLTEAFPDYGWLSEETRDRAERLKMERVWIVDPLDGTREFVMRNPEYVVSVALVENGRPVLGVIYNPVTEDLYAGAHGQGVQLNGQTVTCRGPEVRPVQVEVSRSDIEKGRFAGFGGAFDLVPRGSIAYKLARVASGLAHATVSVTPKNEWDIAAGILLVQEAGGCVLDLAGEEHCFNQADTLVNGLIAAGKETFETIQSAVTVKDAI